MKVKSTVLCIAAAAFFSLTGCDKKPESIASIEEILDPTETRVEDRNDLWYSKQENIRNAVLFACFSHFNEKAQIAGGKILYDYYENPYALFNEIPDCINARKGEVLTLNKQSFTQDEVEINSVKEQLQTEENDIHIARSAEEVAKRLDAISESKTKEDENTLEIINNITKDGPDIKNTLQEEKPAS